MLIMSWEYGLGSDMRLIEIWHYGRGLDTQKQQLVN
jgi:hypothetical protein